MHYPRISWISIHHIHRFPNDHSSSHMAKKSAKSIHLGKCFRDLDPTATWGGGGFNKPWPPGLGGKQTSPWRSESWIHGVGRAFMSFHSQSAFMSFHIFISFVLYHTTQSVSHFWIKQMVFRNSTQKKNTTTIVQRKDPPLLRSNAEPEYWNSVGGAFGGETSGEKRINLFRRLMDDRKQSDPK